MAPSTLLFLVIIPSLMIGQSMQGVSNNQIDLEPIQELTDHIMSSKNIDKVGGMIQKIIQVQGADGLADIFSNLFKEDNSGATGKILKGLGNVIQEKLQGKKAATDNSKRGETGDKDAGFNIDPAMIGSLISMFSGSKDNKEGPSFDPSMIGNVISMFAGGKEGKEGGGSIDPSMIGNVISMFAGGKDGKEGGSIDPSMIANVASMFLPKEQKDGEGSGGIDLSAIASMVSMFAPKTEKERSEEGGFDPALIANIASMFASKAEKKDKPPSPAAASPGFGMENIISMVSGLMSQDGSESYMQFIPTILNTLGHFVGPEAEQREHDHAEHSWMLPPIFEKLHVMFDHFVHSPFGQSVMEKIGAEKYVKIFLDEKTGNFSYNKFVELLENHSFRRHWISMVTKRVSGVVAYFADPYNQRKFITTTQFFINNFLKQQGVPKAALFDPTRPTETLSSLANHLSKQYLGQKIDAKVYIGPAVTYVKDLISIAESNGLVGKGIDSDKLTNKLTDTINMDIIEPVVRVNRAYRFATKVPSCSNYVICLVTQDTMDDDPSLPGLKKALGKGASFVASWFLSGKGDNSFWTLYNVITDVDNCKALYKKECQDFHIEEVKVTTEYVHNEL